MKAAYTLHTVGAYACKLLILGLKLVGMRGFESLVSILTCNKINHLALSEKQKTSSKHPEKPVSAYTLHTPANCTLATVGDFQATSKAFKFNALNDFILRKTPFCVSFISTTYIFILCRFSA